MPFINSKISTSLTEAQETEIKTRLGQAIQTIPGKSENWLMVGFEPDYKLYFRGSNTEPMAMVEVSVYGSENPSAFSKLTGQICDIFKDVLGIAPPTTVDSNLNGSSPLGSIGSNLTLQ